MKKIHLLDFFRTGKLGPVSLGMSQDAVFAEFGEPDRWINTFEGDPDNINKKPFVPTKALVWGYGAIELYWFKPNTGLPMISFGVDSLHWASTMLEIDRWIFRKNKGKSWMCTYLKAALDKEKIPYQDTGLEIVSFKEKGYEVISFNKNDAAEHDPDDVFGTLVLKSGVQVRYGEEDYIISISMPGMWLVKGREQFIEW